MVRVIAVLALLLCASVTSGLVSPFAKSSSHDVSAITRRETLGSIAAVGAVLLGSQPAFAASQEDTDKANIAKGYKRLVYLLDNWEKETTVCKTGQETTFGDRCERTPLKVQEYLGYKSMNDPLFNVEKTLRRLSLLVPEDRDIDYFEAMENLLQNAEEANSMAFVSSWGEANPGGGKDRVQSFIERAKNNVIVSKTSLETVMNILGIKA
jgi:hypothetical protein